MINVIFKFINLRPLLAEQCPEPLLDPFRSVVANVGPLLLLVVPMQALPQILSWDHQLIFVPARGRVSRNCNSILPKYHSTVKETEVLNHFKMFSLIVIKILFNGYNKYINFIGILFQKLNLRECLFIFGDDYESPRKQTMTINIVTIIKQIISKNDLTCRFFFL